MNYLAVKSIGTESRKVIARELGERKNGELLFNKYSFSFGEYRKVLEVDGNDDGMI